MKKIFPYFLILSCLSCLPLHHKKESPLRYAASITVEELKDHLFVYASDEYEGRNTGEPGQKKAVAYLKNFYIS